MATIPGKWEKKALKRVIIGYILKGHWGSALTAEQRGTKNPGDAYEFILLRDGGQWSLHMSTGYCKGPGHREEMFKHVVKWIEEEG